MKLRRSKHVENAADRAYTPEMLLNYKVDEETGCWLWKGPMVSNKPYLFWPQTGKRNYSARRLLWDKYRGPLEDDHNLHTDFCRYYNCVNPDHYEAFQVKHRGDKMRDLRQMRTRAELTERRKLTPAELFGDTTIEQIAPPPPKTSIFDKPD